MKDSDAFIDFIVVVLYLPDAQHCLVVQAQELAFGQHVIIINYLFSCKMGKENSKESLT